MRDAVLHRPGAEVDRGEAALPHARRSAAASSATRTARRLALRLDEPADGAAPGQVACLMRGDVVVGHGVIA